MSSPADAAAGTPRPVRLAPLTAEQWDDEIRTALTGLLPRSRHDPERSGNAVSVMVRHPGLARALLTFNLHLLTASTLPPRLRELVVLRTAARRGCAYELFHHTRLAREEGLSEAEIEAAQRGEAAGELERAALAASDELDADSAVSDATWATLAAHLDERQLMDLVFTAGCYALLAGAFNTFGVQPERER